MSIFGVNRYDVKDRRRSRAKSSLKQTKTIRTLERRTKVEQAKADYHKARADIESEKARKREARSKARFSLTKTVRKLKSGKSGKMRIF